MIKPLTIKTKKMKKNLMAIVIVTIATITGTNKANAQIASNTNSLEYQKSIIGTANPTISPRAVRNFINTYKNVTDVSWSEVKDGFAARFNSDDIRNTVFYDKKGSWVSSIKLYHEEKMPRDIRHIVKSTYYDYNIIYTQEIETPDSNEGPTYIICLDDKSNIKLVRVHAGEMSVWKEYTKAN